MKFTLRELIHGVGLGLSVGVMVTIMRNYYFDGIAYDQYSLIIQGVVGLMLAVVTFEG